MTSNAPLHRSRRALLALLALGPAGAHAQTPGADASPAMPLVAPGHELKGLELAGALRNGGFILYMRHALQIPPAEKEVCDKPSLKPEGEAQARKVGMALRELKIPIGQVKSSEPCRSQDTARLLDVGKVEITADLNPLGGPKSNETIAARKRLTAQQPAQGANTILVSHVHGSRVPEDRMQLEIAEIIVYRPDGKGASTPVARVRWEAWDDLVKAAQPK